MNENKHNNNSSRGPVGFRASLCVCGRVENYVSIITGQGKGIEYAKVGGRSFELLAVSGPRQVGRNASVCVFVPSILPLLGVNSC